MREMTSMEIGKMVQEMKQAEGGIIKKVFSTRGKLLVLRVFMKGGEKDLVFMPGFLFMAPKVPQALNPEGFAMLLRKLLKGRRISSISQLNNDRIVKIDIADYSLVIEMFRELNVIVLKSGIVMAAMSYGKWKDREIRRGQQYVPPPSRTYEEMLDRPLEAYLTFSGFGKPYSAEFIDRFGNRLLKDINRQELEAMMDEMRARPASPKVNGDDYAVIDVRGFSGKPVDSISSIFTILYKQTDSQPGKTDEKKSTQSKIEYDIQRLEQKLASVEKRISWIESHPEIYEEFEKMRHSGKRIISIGPLQLDIARPLRDQLSDIYEKRKKLRQKLRKAHEVLEKGIKQSSGSNKVARRKSPGLSGLAKRFRVFNYGRFRFILGKDAETNEELVKKFGKQSPVIAHCLVHGSPFGIVQGEMPEGYERFLAELVAIYSSAWKSGIGVVESYWVLPEQVSKKAPSGEYMGKGSFMIYGKKHMVKAVLRLGFCFSESLMVGPEQMLKELCRGRIVVVTPGSMKARDVAKLVRNRIGKQASIDEIERYIPYGQGEVEI